MTDCAWKYDMISWIVFEFGNVCEFAMDMYLNLPFRGEDGRWFVWWHNSKLK